MLDLISAENFPSRRMDGHLHLIKVRENAHDCVSGW